MELKSNYETKVVVTGGSLRTTVPKNIAKLLNIKEGCSLCWELHITEKEAILTVTPKIAKEK